MTNAATEPQSLPDAIVSITINAPIQRVWDEITKTGRVQRAMYNTVLESDLVPGSRLRYFSIDRKRVFVVGKVIEVTPPTRFVHSYVFCQAPGPETQVTWELEEVDGGTQVNITHTGWTTEHPKVKEQTAGWKQILGLLKTEVETGQIPFGMRMMYAVMSKTMFMLPKTTKVEEMERRGW